MQSRLRTNLIRGSARDGFDKQSWIEEADRHIRSASILRASRKRRRAALARNPQLGVNNVMAMDAAVHSSFLLLSYSVELFLKAGLTRAYFGCSQDLFKRDGKRFSHNLVKLAGEIAYPLSSKTKKDLRDLQKIILSEGRYPFLSVDSVQQRKKVNQRAHKFWSDERFREVQELSKSIRKHVQRIDGDSADPSTFRNAAIDDDGYFSFRCGGRLPPRITVKYSSLQRSARTNNKMALKRLVTSHFQNPLIAHFWDSAFYQCVKL